MACPTYPESVINYFYIQMHSFWKYVAQSASKTILPSVSMHFICISATTTTTFVSAKLKYFRKSAQYYKKSFRQ